MEALDPAELRRLVLAAVAPHIDRNILAARVAQEDRERARLRAVIAEADRALPGDGEQR